MSSLNVTHFLPRLAFPWKDRICHHTLALLSPRTLTRTAVTNASYSTLWRRPVFHIPLSLFSQQSDRFFTVASITRNFFFSLSNRITSGHSNRKENMVQHLVDRGRKGKGRKAAACRAGRPARSSGAHRGLVKPEAGPGWPTPTVPEGPRGGGHVTGLHLGGSKGPTGEKGTTLYDKFRDSFREQDKSCFVYITESSCTILWINLRHWILKPYLKTTEILSLIISISHSQNLSVFILVVR